MKIFDCFTYFNEDQLLKLRLETLWDVVDVFVVCESKYSFTGKPKPVNFDLSNYEKYRSKIRYLLINEYPFVSNSAWDFERYQRDYLVNGLFDAQDEDWVMISDVDEIITPDVIQNYNPSRYLRGSFIQCVYIYYLNNQVLRYGSPFLWDMPKITTYKNFKNIFGSLNELRNYKSSGVLRGIKRNFIKLNTQKIINGGWHFTWLGGVEKILLKLDSQSHQELNTPENRNPVAIEYKIRTGGDIFNQNVPGSGSRLVALGSNMPHYLIQNLPEFENLILKP